MDSKDGVLPVLSVSVTLTLILDYFDTAFQQMGFTFSSSGVIGGRESFV